MKPKVQPSRLAANPKPESYEPCDSGKRLAEALDQKAATDGILRVMADSPGDVQPVLYAVAERAARLCDALFAQVLLIEGEVLQPTAAYWADAGLRARHDHPDKVKRSLPLKRSFITGRAALDCLTIHHADAVPLIDTEYPDVRAKQQELGWRAVLAVPLRRRGGASGVIFMFRSEPRAFSPEEIGLVETFAQQAAIAIDNTRHFNETKEALEQQTAISEILRVISTSPGDLKPMLHAVAERALKLCAAADATIFLVEEDKLRVAARFGTAITPMPEGHFMPLTRGSVTGRAVTDGLAIHIEDLAVAPEDEFPIGREIQRRLGHHTALSVPLMREDRAIGAIALWRMETQQFTDRQIALVKTFADQAVIAIENARLLNETKEGLERQTATSEILGVISQSPTDAQPVFDTIAVAAIKLCGGSFATVVRFDGELVDIVAFTSGWKAEEAEAVRTFYPMPPSRDTVASRAILMHTVVHIPDVLEDPDYAIREIARSAGYRSAVGVPLMLHGKPIGAIGVGRPEVGLFPEKQVALLETFADQAVIAIENVRLFTELEVRTRDLTRSVGELKALGEVGQAVSSTLDLETVLSTIVARAAQLAGMDGGSIWEYDELREEFHLRATDRLPHKLVEALRAAPIRKGEGALGRLAITSEPVQIRDIADERTYQSRVRQATIQSGFRSILAVPLLREDHLLGALAVNRASTGEFASEVIELLKTFATQSALAIQNARLYREIEVKSQQLEAASRHKSEFLANMSHELRTPLNAIIGFSEVLSERMFGEINDKQAEYVSDILESGRHLLSLINDILDLSKIEAGRMELDLSDFNLRGTIENTLTLVRERATRRSIALGCKIDERVGLIRGDERKVKQVLLNLLSNALKFTPVGGKIDIRAAITNDVAEISVNDTGVGIAPEDQATVFEEFRQVGTASKKVEGTGLGLAISRKFIELHGGQLWVTSQVGTGSTFAFTLPLQ